jgi:hypothetical protein
MSPSVGSATPPVHDHITLQRPTAARSYSGQDEETEKQLMELVGDRAIPSDMLALADESVALREAFATPINAGVAS